MAYKYKLKEFVTSKEAFQAERITAFDQIEDMLDVIKKHNRKAKLHTIRYYNENPESYAVVYSTDLVKEYLNDIISLIKEEE